MAWKPAGVLRIVLSLLCLQLASACGDEPSESTPPPLVDNFVPTARATPPGGTFTAPVSVTLTCEDPEGSGCVATYYTTDGSSPTSNSNRYTGPITVAVTTTLKFFSVDAAGNASELYTETYTF